METANNNQSSKGARITGLVIIALVVLFNILDGVMKIMKATPSMEGSGQLGWPLESVQVIGILLTVFTILYVIPRTALIGAILITAYLGGAVSIMMRTNTPYYFPIVMGALVWTGLSLRNPRLRQLIF
jgi:hypothetical protein